MENADSRSMSILKEFMAKLEDGDSLQVSRGKRGDGADAYEAIYLYAPDELGSGKAFCFILDCKKKET